MNTVSEKIDRIVAGDSWAHQESIIHGLYPRLSEVDRATIHHGVMSIMEPEMEWTPYLDYELQIRRYVPEPHLYGTYLDFSPREKLVIYMETIDSMYHPYATRASISEELKEKLPVERVKPSAGTDDGFFTSLSFHLEMAEISEES